MSTLNKLKSKINNGINKKEKYNQVVTELQETLDERRNNLQRGEITYSGNNYLTEQQKQERQRRTLASASFNPNQSKKDRNEELKKIGKSSSLSNEQRPIVVAPKHEYIRKKSKSSGKIYYENRKDGTTTWDIPKNGNIFEMGDDGKSLVQLEKVNPFPSCSVKQLSGYTRKRFILSNDGTSFTRYCPTRRGGKRYKGRKFTKRR